jgi:hypothetical protein
MRKTIALVLILALVFTLGCGGKAKPAPTDDVSGPAALAAEPATTSDAVLEVESDVDGLDDLDEDFLSDDLDALDADLDFEI